MSRPNGSILRRVWGAIRFALIPDQPSLGRVLGALAVVLVALAAGATPAADEDSAGAAGWQGLLGSRPIPQLGSRWIVVLRAPSLADRVRRAGGTATESQMRTWTASARNAQRKAIVRLAFHGAPIDPEQSYVRIFNGFAAAIDPRLLPVLERDPVVTGVYPVRAVYPAAVAAPGIDPDAPLTANDTRVGVRLPGSDGTGITVAQLDTGIDTRHPFLRGNLLPGIDVLDPGSDASAEQNPTQPGRPERHGTELAGLVVGSHGPGGLHGVAPGVSLLPIRVAGWQPDAEGGVSVYGRSDQLLAGLEAAVDPNGDGDAHDAARVALVGVVEPFASFADGPLARGARGALALGTLVVAPAGNDGAAGPGYGSVAGPAGTGGALGVAALDSRRRSPTAHVLLRAGLRVLASGETSLGGVGRSEVVDAPVVALPRRQVVAVTEGNALDRLFDAKGYSRVAGTAALLPPGPTTPEVVSELSAAGVRAVLVQGPIPAGSLGIDDPVEVPVVGLPLRTARTLRAALATDVPVELSVGASAFAQNPSAGAVAAFSSTGLAFDGSLQPELGAPGVGLVTSVPGRNEGGSARYGTISGSSAAAAVVAGAAALLADARPDLDAAGLRAALVGTSRRGNGGAAVGLVNPQGASAAELVADPPVVSLGALAGKDTAKGRITLRNVSRRPLRVRLGAAAAPAGVTVRASRATLGIRPGRAVTVGLTVRVGTRPAAPTALGGALVATAGRGVRVRVPWSVAVPVTNRPVVSAVKLSGKSFAPSDRSPAVLSLVAGRVDGPAERPQILPLERLDIELFRGKKKLGRLVRLRDLLPGRYALGVTGRGPGGARLRSGAYALRIVGVPVGKGRATVVEVPFRLR
ncbi:S8 family serine peptidase [Gaiella sp.]|uniref:S8 family serine peptidase n=1 Tax=Gaiella sp. TaxID=2663207 RepID=UPI002E36A1BC|nr:S8 family serine peptidase [Gaiella sp.]HEX5582302.1 S8 family serine peptidase [Gaiella sp.]